MRLDRVASAAIACAAMAAIAFSLAPRTAHANTSDWNALDAPTQALLAPWRDSWSALPGADRDRLLGNASRWQAMRQADRDALLARQTQWDALSPPERARLRARYADWQQLPAAEQAQVRAAANRFAALPVPQQGALRATFGAQPVDWQHSWLLGPSIGSWLDQASTWFAFVPEGEREPTLRMLQALPSASRAQLFELGRRLSAPQREGLRKDLLQASPSQRAALIAQRLAQ